MFSCLRYSASAAFAVYKERVVLHEETLGLLLSDKAVEGRCAEIGDSSAFLAYTLHSDRVAGNQFVLGCLMPLLPFRGMDDVGFQEELQTVIDGARRYFLRLA